MYEIKIANSRKQTHKTIKMNFTLVLNDVVEIRNVKLVYSEKTNQHYVLFPSFTYKDKYYSYVKFSDSLHRQALEAALKAYNKPEIIA